MYCCQVDFHALLISMLIEIYKPSELSDSSFHIYLKVMHFEGGAAVAHTGDAGGGRLYNSSQTNCLSTFQQISHLAQVPKTKSGAI